MIITAAEVRTKKHRIDTDNDPTAKNADAALSARVDQVGKKTIDPKGIQATAQNLKGRQAVPLMHFPSKVDTLQSCLDSQMPRHPKILDMRYTLTPPVAYSFSGTSCTQHDVSVKVDALCEMWQATLGDRNDRTPTEMFAAALKKALLACHKEGSAFKLPERSTRSMSVVGNHQIAVEGRGNVIVQGSGNSAVVENNGERNVIVKGNPGAQGSTVTVNGKTYPEGIHRLRDGTIIVNKE